jgi:hypothetical protein
MRIPGPACTRSRGCMDFRACARRAALPACAQRRHVPSHEPA